MPSVTSRGQPLNTDGARCSQLSPVCWTSRKGRYYAAFYRCTAYCAHSREGTLILNDLIVLKDNLLCSLPALYFYYWPLHESQFKIKLFYWSEFILTVLLLVTLTAEALFMKPSRTKQTKFVFSQSCLEELVCAHYLSLLKMKATVSKSL